MVGNFSIRQGERSFECDAVAFGPSGWAYLIETKAWTGQIRGNDVQWELPPLVGDDVLYRPNPVELTQLKARVLATALREEDPPLKGIFIQPVVGLVSDDEPELEGSCADFTVLARDLVVRVLEDPRPYSKKVPEDAAERASAVLKRSTVPIAPSNVLGSWELIEEHEAGPTWEVWSARARLAGSAARPMRLKRYWLDPLLTGEERQQQRDRARRDLDALQRLNGADGAVPLVSTVDEPDDSFVVVTEWPSGESLASMLEDGPLAEQDAEEVFEALVRALGSVHRLGVVHRNLSPRCAHFLSTGRVVVTDFDYARLPSASGGVTQHIGEELANDYAAPEVTVDPAQATKASDVWSLARIGLMLFGADDSLDAIPQHWRRPFERALSEDPGVRSVDAELFLVELEGESSAPPLFEGFEPKDELEERWVVRSEPIGEGGIARVYRVHDTTTQRDYAAKFVRDEVAHLIDPVEEYQLLFDVPDHPCVVKPEFPERMTKFRRGGKQHELRKTFLVTRWVEGTRLDRLLAEKLGPVRCVELVLALADAVAHLHAYRLLHRDLKPQNVIVDAKSGNPRLVDFNVSRAVETAERTEIGTPPYRPPDHDQTGWAYGSDVYGLAVILCELLAGRLLRPSVRPWLEGDAAIPAPLRPVLMRATAPKNADRYQTIDEFRSALAAALVDLRRPPGPIDAIPLPVPPVEELERPDWNPYQSRLVSLFSQSRTTNAGTRGLDDFGRWAYVETLVDDRLFPDIVWGKYGLVVITGNAGDGKTAFIQMFEGRLTDDGATVEPREGGNGSTLVRHDHRFVTNWDGSQDEGEYENDDVLLDFFAPFAGERPNRPAAETRVIAINEGRLLDFVAEHRDAFPWLSETVLAMFTEQTLPEEEWVCIVNLNLRALTLASNEGHESIVHRLLGRFSDSRLWEPCAGCQAERFCYARANAEALRDPVLGGRASERIRQTLDLVRLRRRLHITMRDLRSALAFIVAGNRTCDEIVALVENHDREALLAGHLYNSLFAASDKLNPPARAPEAVRDRLLNVVGTLDVAKTSNPEDDARLWALGVTALRPDPETLTRTDRELLEELKERLPKSSSQLSDRRARASLRHLQASLRRKLFLERENPEWLAMYPYERLSEFIRQLRTSGPGDRDAIATAISNSEGLFSESFDNVVAVRLARESDGADRSFVTHPTERFRLDALDRGALAQYVEYAPDSLVFRHADDEAVALEIDLDLFEMLIRVLEGFTPSREELRGAWLNLRIFKDQLASLPSDALLLSRDDRHFFNVRRVDGPAVAVEEAS